MVKVLFLAIVVLFNGCVSTQDMPASQARSKNLPTFKTCWVSPDVDFNKYNVVLIEAVDTSQAKHKEQGVEALLDDRADFEEAKKIAQELQARFAKGLNAVIPTETDKTKISGRKAMALNIKLTEIVGADVEANIATEIFMRWKFSDAALGMEAKLIDLDTGEELANFKDRRSPNVIEGTATVLGSEGFDRWQGAYNVIDFWADRLAIILAEKRGQNYNPTTKIKILGDLPISTFAP